MNSRMIVVMTYMSQAKIVTISAKRPRTIFREEGIGCMIASGAVLRSAPHWRRGEVTGAASSIALRSQVFPLLIRVSWVPRCYTPAYLRAWVLGPNKFAHEPHGVGGGRCLPDGARLVLELLAVALVGAGADEALGLAVGVGGGEPVFGDLPRPGGDVVVLDDLRHQTPLQGLLRREHAVGKGEGQGAALADRAGEAGADRQVGGEADLRVDAADLGALAHDRVVAGEEDAQPAPGGRAVGRGDDGFGGFAQGDDPGVDEAGHVGQGVLAVLHLEDCLDVAPGAERPPGGGDDDGGDVVVGGGA